MSVLEDWTETARLALELDTDLDQALVLDLARESAHGVTRPAAPITTYLLGLAVGRGADPRQAAERLTELARGWRPDQGGD
ncbi:MAG: DUF6457 domain-containing protein [Micromonosporaceae bacterium]